MALRLVSRVLLSAWCLFHGWDIGTLDNTLSGCVTQDPRVGSSEACAIHPTHLVVCTSETYCCACRLVHKWMNEGLMTLWDNPKLILSKCVSCINVSWKYLAAVAVMQLHWRCVVLTLLCPMLGVCIQCLWVWSASFAVLKPTRVHRVTRYSIWMCKVNTVGYSTCLHTPAEFV